MPLRSSHLQLVASAKRGPAFNRAESLEEQLLVSLNEVQIEKHFGVKFVPSSQIPSWFLLDEIHAQLVEVVSKC